MPQPNAGLGDVLASSIMLVRGGEDVAKLRLQPGNTVGTIFIPDRYPSIIHPMEDAWLPQRSAGHNV